LTGLAAWWICSRLSTLERDYGRCGWLSGSRFGRSRLLLDGDRRLRTRQLDHLQLATRITA
jgi:hypothetical protein